MTTEVRSFSFSVILLLYKINIFEKKNRSKSEKLNYKFFFLLLLLLLLCLYLFSHSHVFSAFCYGFCSYKEHAVGTHNNQHFVNAERKFVASKTFIINFQSFYLYWIPSTAIFNFACSAFNLFIIFYILFYYFWQ